MFFPKKKREAARWQITTKKPIVIPAKAGIHRQCEAWIPAFAGMTMGNPPPLRVEADFT